MCSRNCDKCKCSCFFLSLLVFVFIVEIGFVSVERQKSVECHRQRYMRNANLSHLARMFSSDITHTYNAVQYFRVTKWHYLQYTIVFAHEPNTVRIVRITRLPQIGINNKSTE